MILDGEADVYCKHCKIKIKKENCGEIEEIHYSVNCIPCEFYENGVRNISEKDILSGKVKEIYYPLYSSITYTFLTCPKCGNKLSDEPYSELIECFAFIKEEELMMIIKSKFSDKYKKLLSKKYLQYRGVEKIYLSIFEWKAEEKKREKISTLEILKVLFEKIIKKLKMKFFEI